jgi:diguanylate cyclase (GGDEF)-like protein
MGLDLHTLLLVTIYVEAMLGLLLLFAWAQNTRIYAVAWWGFAHLFRSASVTLFGLYGSASDLITIDLANALLFTAFAMTYIGARLFDGRSFQPIALVAGAVVWLLLSRTALVADSMDARVLLSSGIVAIYTWLTAVEFWRGRAEPLVSRIPAVCMLFAHGALYLMRTPTVSFVPWSAQSQILSSVWLTVLSFEALLFTISIAFILLAMAKERTEFQHKTAALIDPLTGIPNRRAFLERASELLSQRANSGQPWAVLLLDLDHFKSINDRFGHAIGDQILQIFAETTQSKLERKDLIGRLGGEEFAIILPDAGREKALAVAERIRSTFADAAATVDGCAVNSTVSVGVVVEEGAAPDIATVLSQADQALYYAKARGRNRVELASLDLVRDHGRRHLPIAASAPTQSAA